MTGGEGTSLWRLPPVRNFLASNALAMVAISLMLAVLFKQAFDLTDDTLTIGIIGLLQFIPAVLFVVVSGYLADRFDRRRLTALMTVGRIACAIAFLAYSRRVGDADGSDAAVWPLFAITLAFGSFDAIGIPARHAITPLVVQRALLPRLVAARATTMVLATIVGPVAAGFLYTVGAELALNGNLIKREGMAEWNELRGSFCRRDSGYPCHRQDITLLDLVFTNQIHCFRLEDNAP